MDKIIFDTNIWVALFNNADSQHQKACDLVRTLENNISTLYISNYIDIECSSILLKRVSFEASHTWLQYRQNSSWVEMLYITAEEHEGVTELFKKLQNKDLSFVDVSLLFFITEGYKIYTFDTKLQKMIQRLYS